MKVSYRILPGNDYLSEVIGFQPLTVCRLSLSAAVATKIIGIGVASCGALGHVPPPPPLDFELLLRTVYFFFWSLQSRTNSDIGLYVIV